nr:hypothetical protein [uncultured Mucilaginibacter sp.]
MKKIWTIRLSVFSFALAVLFVSCQKENSSNGLKTIDDKPAINFTPAKTSAELLALRAQKSANLVRTLEDFDKVASSKTTPLRKLSPTQLADFRKSLVVREGVGVVSLYYGDLKETLSYDDFSTVLALFGLDVKEGYWGLSNDPAIQSKLVTGNTQINAVDNGVNSVAPVEDHSGYLCSALLLHTCKKAANSICLSGC